MDSRTSAGWLIVRTTAGLFLALLHGRPKVFDGKMESFAQAVADIGFPFPLFFAWCAALSELAGGLLLAFGLFTRPAAAFAGFTMLVAASRHWHQGFGKMELSLVFLSVCIFGVVAGGGRYSLDRALPARLKFLRSR